MLRSESGPEVVPRVTGTVKRARTVRDAERTRAGILAAATHEFARYGLGGARVDRIAERARSTWERGDAAPVPAEEEADPATAFVDDMETGLKIHQRLLEQQRDAGRFAR